MSKADGRRMLHRFGWNNWTFGVWWSSKRDRYRAFGVDLGPLELCWRKIR